MRKQLHSLRLLLLLTSWLFSSSVVAQDLEGWARIKAQAAAGNIDAKNYVVGPGDGFALGIWGEKDFMYDLFVSVEGDLLIPEVGSIHASGLTIAELRELVQNRVGEVFTKVEVTFILKQVRIFRVTIAGEVTHPDFYLASALDRVSDLVVQAGGLLQQASKRRIELRRGTKVLAVDLAKFYSLGNNDSNPLLREGDEVFVPVLKDIVSVFGLVLKPGDYELIPGESLADILQFTGGLNENALLDSIEVARFDEHGYQIVKTVVTGWEATSRWLLQKDDRIMVRGEARWHRKRGVTLRGEVRYPGYYAINRGETTLSQLIAMAGGFSEEASLVESKVIRATDESVIDYEFERLKKMNPADMTEMEYSYYKQKSQEVRGTMSVDFVRLFHYQDHSQDILLENGDQIVIPRIRNYIQVSGQVIFPGNIPFRSGLMIDDYIRLAGGYSWNARKSRLRVIKASTGEWLKKSSVKNLQPGDTVWVPERPERDWWLLFREIMTVAAQGATLYLVVHTAANK